MVKLIQSWKLTRVLMALMFIFLTSCGATPEVQNTTIPDDAPTLVAEPSTLVYQSPADVKVTLPEYATDALVDENIWNEIQQSTYIQEQYKQWQAWIFYWSQAQTPLLNPNTPKQFDLVFDPWNLPKDGNDGLEQKVVVRLKWVDTEGQEHFSFFPLDSVNGGYQTTPPLHQRGNMKLLIGLELDPSMRLMEQANLFITMGIC